MDEAYRRQGIGRALIGHIEIYFRTKGFKEMGSDVLLDNTVSHEAHAGWGFTETERVAYYRKVIV